ncbi:hypothetical protein QBZ16_001700 [Prototheca wickerhamii]|uniref:26S proteasome non-ATPase regulatory subunit 1 homolog n=1 Tax=Prototheca wickerhamii TaxID=3111 RepID=A0AAD9IFZ7_PROWI|nr:hypothetical protein QBZ16_001700 [Prototheca wickerhamii]
MAAPLGNSIEGLLALLSESDDSLKAYALEQINASVHHFWHQASGSLAAIEALHEDVDFSHHELAALVASKIFYYLGELKEAQTYALGAGALFDPAGARSDYVRTILDTCLDSYIQARSEAVASGELSLEELDGDATGTPPREPASLDARLGAVVRRLLDGCVAEGQLEQAAGLAELVAGLVRRGGDALLLAMHIAFDLVDAQLHELAAGVAARLGALEVELRRAGEEEEDGEEAADDAHAEDESSALRQPLLAAAAPRPPTRPRARLSSHPPPPPTTIYTPLLEILSGRPTIESERRFLASQCRADAQILRNIKAGVEARNSVCHAAAVWANALMHAGTGVDAFLRSNLDWLAKAANWAKFGATAGLGAIQRGSVAPGRARALMSPYLPAAPGGATGSPFSEGGALFALGLIHVNQGAEVRAFLAESLRAATAEPVQHGACLGLGVAGLGSGDAGAVEDVKNVLYTDSAVAGEAAAYALGLLTAGRADGDERIAEMLAYARDTSHEKVVRGLGIGVALALYGREEEADGAIEALARDQDATLRYAAQFAVGLAYRGTRNNAAIQRLLHFAVADVSRDVRRAAVMNLGFLLISAPEKCPRLVALLAGSYDPHVRYGAAMAVGIACAGTGSKEAVALLEPMLNDVTDFVQQGVLIALALVLAGQPAWRAETLRARIDKMHANKGVEVLVRMGAIMAAGILDVGGRNSTVALQARTGAFRRTAVLGVALFAQYWFWHPLAYFLSVSLAPSAIIGLDASLQMPRDFAVVSRCKPSAFAYPAPVAAEDKKSRDKAPTAVLSTTARVKARAASKKERAAEEAGAPAGAMETEDEEAGEGKAEEEPASYTIPNPARVVPAQRRFVAFDPEQRWRPVKAALSGVLVLRDTRPDEGEPEYLFQEAPRGAPPSAPGVDAAGAPERREPAPPAPFEYIPS